MEKFLCQAMEPTYGGEHSQNFMKKNWRKRAMYTKPAECVSPTGKKLIGNVVINGRTYI